MTIALDLAYVAPTSLEDALGQFAGADGSTMILAGGTDVIAMLRDDVIQPTRLIDLKRIPGLSSVEIREGSLHIGCLATFSDLLASDPVQDRFPGLEEMARLVASVGIRNRATVVGNICSAVPSCDAGPVLLTHDAVIHTAGPAGERAIPIDQWFVGPRRTAIEDGEIVTHLTIPVPRYHHGAAYARLSRTRGEDLAQASVAVLVEPGYRYRVAFGAVAASALRARRIETLLAGSGVDAETIDAAVDLVRDEVAPITDVRATARYRLRMCEVMLRRAVIAATGRAAGDGPRYDVTLV